MKFVIAPDSFKGCMTAKTAAEAIREGLSRVFPDAEYVMVPMADGGEGTVQSLIDATGGVLRQTRVLDPLQRETVAAYGLLGDVGGAGNADGADDVADVANIADTGDANDAKTPTASSVPASSPSSTTSVLSPASEASPTAAFPISVTAPTVSTIPTVPAATSSPVSAISPTTGTETETMASATSPSAQHPIAVIEMAAASGLQFVDDITRNPLITTTYGTGQLIRAALDDGARTIILGVGGSATNDGGAGMAEALGARFLDATGNPIPRGGGFLDRLASIDVSGMDPRLADTTVLIACDVTNPLIGPNGASAVFGPQKGATPEMVERLDANLTNYAAVIAHDLGIDVAHVPGAGGAGGLGAGLLAFTNAAMRSGVEIVAQTVRLTERAADADYCITGEGGIDFQTQYGKTPMGVARAVRRGNPQIGVIALAGYVGEGIDQLYDLGIDAVFGIVPGAQSLEQALADGPANLSRTAENVGRLIRLSRSR